MLGKYHYVLYFLVLAMQPRMLWIVDENLKPLSLLVCVGQVVNVVGQAGHPKTITSFQTHYTPVLLFAGDRAKLATEKYLPLSPILEGFVNLMNQLMSQSEIAVKLICSCVDFGVILNELLTGNYSYVETKYGPTKTVSFKIHVVHIPSEHDLAKDGKFYETSQ
ncbi:26S proteasome non-ATPase regulatory subunit 2 1A [Glycine soja]|uniref:26S proteasome non-ATPase regulatory subunit 2 1A n=1 Tax=Glycine soja TaxID=3848 RepID=A0A0B2SDT8_GLYSO|nr:26S proteasome non-ATPase regulatory subunit 2 1A [Glycine soja]